MKRTSCTSIPTPAGDIRIIWTQQEGVLKVHRILLPEEVSEEVVRGDCLFPEADVNTDQPLGLLCLKIREFMSGQAVEFPLRDMDISGCSEFQKKILLRTFEIPRGKVISYSSLSETIGIAGGARAAGSALAKNPFPLVIPCHRIVRETGDLGGFGGGLRLKKSLLEMEGIAFDVKGRVLHEYFLGSFLRF